MNWEPTKTLDAKVDLLREPTLPQSFHLGPFRTQPGSFGSSRFRSRRETSTCKGCQTDSRSPALALTVALTLTLTPKDRCSGSRLAVAGLQVPHDVGGPAGSYPQLDQLAFYHKRLILFP
jgi:hypothetical protein